MRLDEVSQGIDRACFASRTAHAGRAGVYVYSRL